LVALPGFVEVAGRLASANSRSSTITRRTESRAVRSQSVRMFAPDDSERLSGTSPYR
jgi:hypothetical protein